MSDLQYYYKKIYIVPVKHFFNKYLNLIRREGYTLVPLSLYFNEKGVAKLSIGLAKGRKKHDKREADKQRDWNRQKQRLLRELLFSEIQ